MPSVKNPNKPSKHRLAARAHKLKKQRQQASAPKADKIAKSDAYHGARPGLMPTSGPRKPVSAKRQRKLEKKMGYAMKRKMEAEGEVLMKDAAETKKDEKTTTEEEADGMDIS
ncbi:ribosome biogenesis protein ALB1 [Podospora australis]|uniref:Ribosome biogenesis protein ALB1 n=1 Tax=Podospora australis TaxID=1536484 RepID=A0AAN6X0C9_9PEZI|nr:ribosome biogenesis protein ALB1 [Podospora australis]